MRAALRLLASVKPAAARYLEAGAPTGLTGLRTNPSPRATLLYLYATTLDRLREGGVPESSVYRQSVEAVTRHRLALVESVVPEGYDAWQSRALAALERNPGRFGGAGARLADGSTAAAAARDGRFFVLRRARPDVDQRYEEWDGEGDDTEPLEGDRPAESVPWGHEHELTAAQIKEIENKTGQSLEGVEPVEEKTQEKASSDLFKQEDVHWEDEPKLTAAQVEELENKIGAGLIEEVIQVAEGELRLVDTMIEAKVWESLEEKPREGQWSYFERKE